MWPSEIGALSGLSELFGGLVPPEELEATYAEHLASLERAPLEEAISAAYVEGYAIPEPQLGEDVFEYMAGVQRIEMIPGVGAAAREFFYGQEVETQPPALTYAEVPPGRPGPAGPTPYVAEAGFPLAGLATVGLLMLSWDEIMEGLISVIKFGREVWNLLSGMGLVGGGGAPEDYYNVIP